jgi:hypothetical protein
MNDDKNIGFVRIEQVGESDPTRLRNLIEAQADQKAKDRKRERLEKILQTKYKRRNAAITAMRELGLDVESLGCPYAIERRFDNPFLAHFAVVADENGQIKGQQIAARKNIVGRVYAHYTGAAQAIKEKTKRCPSDPACPLKIVRIPQGCRIDIREDKVAVLCDILRRNFPAASSDDITKAANEIHQNDNRAD